MTAGSGADLVVTALGLRVRIRGLHPAAADAARGLWGELAAGTVAAELTLDAAAPTADAADAGSTIEPPTRALGRLAVQLNQLFLAEYTGFAVHAGVIERAGRLVAMPAASGTGKTTMTAAACRLGWGYVSDEALCIDYERGAVTGYPRPLGMSAWTRRALGLDGVGLDVGEEVLVAPRDVAERVVHDPPAPLTDVVVLDRVGGPGRDGGGPAPASLEPARLEPLPRQEIVALLLRRSFNHFRNPEQAVRLAAAAASGARCWQLRYIDPMAGAQALSALWE